MFAEMKLQTICGHHIRARPVVKIGGPKEGQIQIRITGPAINQSVKCLYCRTMWDVQRIVFIYLGGAWSIRNAI